MQLIPTPAHAAVASRFRRNRLAIVLTCLALFGCRDPKIASYRVPKEPVSELPATAPTGTAAALPTETAAPLGSASSPAGGAMAPDQHGLQTAGGQSLTWTAPAAWQPKAASSMRKATYVVTGEGGATAELAISAFPGDVGGEVANLNRWRGQVGLEPVADAAATAAITRLDVNGLKIGIVDVGDASSGGTRLLGGMVPFEGATWFFKLVGPDAVVGSAKPAFVELMKTVKPASAATP